MRKMMIASAVVLSALVVGCDDDSSKTPPPAAPPAQPAAAPQSKSVHDQATDAIAGGKQAVQTAVTEAKQTGEAVIAQAKPKIDAAATQLKQEVTQASQAAGDTVKQLTNTGTTAGAPASEASFDYQQKVQQAVQYVKENKLDLADKTLAEVEARKASVPLSFHPRIESTRKMIDTAKQAKSGLSLPAF